MQIIGQVASCLAELHGHGWVHRDLKPGNIMYLPRTASWTLIDFGLAARAGETARLGYTLAYAAPEVIAAADIGSKSVTADTAVDAWALGVMAFELLTGRPVHCPLTGSPADVRRWHKCARSDTQLEHHAKPSKHLPHSFLATVKSNRGSA